MRPRKTAPRQAESRKVLVDGSNVAHFTEGNGPRLKNILLVLDKLRSEGFEPLIVADAALRHQIDDKAQYEQLIENGVVHQAPAGPDADFLISSSSHSRVKRTPGCSRMTGSAISRANSRRNANASSAS
jgi:hypothetical protein